jgi:S1-C subfamily serine protease
MKKLLMICMLVVGCDGPRYITKYPVNNYYRSSYLASVAICDESGSAIGAATIIENEVGKHIKMVTAGHVVSAMEEKEKAMYACYSYNRKQEPLVSVKVDDLNDIALVRTVKNTEAFGPYVRIAKSEPSIGDSIFLIGSPMRNKFNVTLGIVSNYIFNDKKTKLYRVDAAAFFGNSGGGAFNHNGELEGVLVSGEVLEGFAAIPGGAHVLSLTYLHNLLK